MSSDHHHDDALQPPRAGSPARGCGRARRRACLPQLTESIPISAQASAQELVPAGEVSQKSS